MTSLRSSRQDLKCNFSQFMTILSYVNHELVFLELHIKWLEARCKALKKELDRNKEEKRHLGYFADCASFYEDNVLRSETALNETVAIKISTEKYVKKIKHLVNEGLSYEQIIAEI